MISSATSAITGGESASAASAAAWVLRPVPGSPVIATLVRDGAVGGARRLLDRVLEAGRDQHLRLAVGAQALPLGAAAREVEASQRAVLVHELVEGLAEREVLFGRGREVSLDAMPPSERRIVHRFLRDREGIETFSEGEEPHRYLVIAPAA